MTFNTRMCEYVKPAKIPHQDMAAFLNCERVGTCSSWFRTDDGAREPEKIDDFRRIANRMFVTKDWLTGEPDAEMWSRKELQKTRQAVLEHIAANDLSSLDPSVRIKHLLKFTCSLDKEDIRTYAIPLAAASGIPYKVLKTLVEGKKDVTLPGEIVKGLSAFWGINSRWLAKGEGEVAPKQSSEASDYDMRLLAAVKGLGINEDFLNSHKGLLAELIDSDRIRQATLAGQVQ